MNIGVTSASQKEQKLSKTGAAVFFIGQEDLRRSGGTSTPDPALSHIAIPIEAELRSVYPLNPLEIEHSVFGRIE